MTTQISRRYLRTILILALSAAALALTGCLVSSIRPFYFDWNVVDVAHLEGTWRVDDEETWTLEADGDRYLWRVVEGDDETVFEAVFFELQGRLYFDYQVPEDAYGGDENLEIYTIRTHTVARVRLEGDVLFVELPDYEVLDQALKDGDLDVGHYRDGDDRVVLTGSTAELQGLLAWCVSRTDCLGDGAGDGTAMTRLDR